VRLNLLQRAPKWAGKTFAAAFVFATLAGFAGATPAHADTGSAEYEFVARINAARAANGVGPLVVDGNLVDVARRWASVMASQGDISHNPNLRGDLGSGHLGENVGMGPAVESIEAAFENSPHHLANMLDPAFTYIGVGVVDVDGYLFVTEDYKSGATAVRAATATPASAPVTAAPRRVTPVTAPAPRPAPPTTVAPPPPPPTTSTTVPHGPAPAVVWQTAPAPAPTHAATAGGDDTKDLTEHGPLVALGVSLGGLMTRRRFKR
jgi:hypothetical protein